MNRTLRSVAQGAGAALALHAAVLAVRPAAGPPAVPPLDEAAGRMRTVLVHYVPDAEFVRPTYRDLLRALPADVRVIVACAAAEDAADFGTRFGREALPLVLGRPITTWARDRFVAGRDGTLVLPPEPHPGGAERRNDALVPPALAQRLGRAVRTARFRFDGGDFCAVGDRVLATSTWARRNPELPPAELIDAAERLFGRRILYLPDAPEHHVGMAVAPLGPDHVLVGDVRWGRRLAPAGFAADLTEETAARFDALAAALVAAGLRVDRIPVLPTATPFAWITYTNALFEDRVVYLPTYGLPALDAAATDVYRAHGLSVRPIDVSGAYPHGGTLHCLVHVLERTGGAAE